jgi:hypothetical protein
MSMEKRVVGRVKNGVHELFITIEGNYVLQAEKVTGGFWLVRAIDEMKREELVKRDESIMLNADLYVNGKEEALAPLLSRLGAIRRLVVV